ncbi:MAG: oligosaccharyl transferase, archaeosortase A system-associated [Archaeoglobaceae archaeon]
MSQTIKKKLPYLLILLISVILAIKLRIFNPWDSVFTFTVRLSENDPWYYYRLIENCIHNFPERIWFDPMTQYPYGTYTHFGPFLVYLSAIIAILSGATSGEALRSVLVFIPAFGGILAIFATFLLARNAFGVKTALLSALLISIIPGQFLHRSILSFNDHHVWEVFFMCTSLAFFISILKGEWNRKGLLLAVLGGLNFGMYILAWAPGFTFGLFLVAAIFFALIFKFKIPENAYKLAILYFITATLIYLPFAFKAPSSPALYSPMQLLMLLFYTTSVIFLWQFDLRFEKFAKYVRISKETTLTLFAIIGLFLVSTIFPELSLTIGTVTGYLQPKGGALTIGEVQPFFILGGGFSLAPAFYHFGTTFFFAIPGMIYLAFLVYKKRELKDLTMFLWAILIFIALCGQNRFAYYFAAVSAIFSALSLNFVFEKLHFYKLLVKERGNLSLFRVIFAILIAIFLIYPTYSLAESQSRAVGALNKQWFDAMVWLRENTPENGYEEYYFKLYEPGKVGEKYEYPFETYGVISWWDYGHWILAIGKRMAIANPFQQGIGNFYDEIPGAAPFFVTNNESYAEKIAEKLNVRYVVSDIEMATGKFYAMATWAEGDLPLAAKYYDGILYLTPQGTLGIGEIPPPGSFGLARIPSRLYYETMEARFHIFDGSGLKHYRMVYESEPSDEWKFYLSYLNQTNPLEIAVYETIQRARFMAPPSFSATEIFIKFVYLYLYQKEFGIPINLTATGYVKIFERVKGVTVKGKANSEYVEVSAKIKTNQGRIFEYYQKVKVQNGEFEIVLPYSHDAKYETKPVTPYEFRSGEIVKTLLIEERQVVNGEVIQLDLL